jgi:hypothetical protein
MRPFHTGEILLQMVYQWNQVKNIKQQFSLLRRLLVLLLIMLNSKSLIFLKKIIEEFLNDYEIKVSLAI